MAPRVGHKMMILYNGHHLFACEIAITYHIPKLLLLPIILSILYRNNNSCGFTLKTTAKVSTGTLLAEDHQNL